MSDNTQYVYLVYQTVHNRYSYDGTEDVLRAVYTDEQFAKQIAKLYADADGGYVEKVPINKVF